MSTINHQTGLPYMASSLLAAYSHSAAPGPMTAEQFVEAWRRLLAEDIEVSVEESACPPDQYCRISVYPDYPDCGDAKDFEGFDPDPLKAFEQAFRAYREAQETK